MEADKVPTRTKVEGWVIVYRWSGNVCSSVDIACDSSTSSIELESPVLRLLQFRKT